MRKHLLTLSLLAAAVVLAFALPAQAEHRSHRRGRAVDSPRVIILSPGNSHAHHRRGWDRGRKVGWGHCDLPPGLAKKYGCRSTFFRGDRHRHHRFDRHHQRFDRRFRRDSGVVIRVPGLLHLDLR